MSSSMNNLSNNNWRNPSAAHMKEYNLNPLPDDFEPTDEEKGLLNMYDVVRNYEREAARLREEAARAKLAAADAEFQSKKAPKRKRRRKQKTYENPDDDLDDDSDDDIESEEDEDEEQARRDRREAKLAELREEVEQAKQNEQNDAEEIALRSKLLAESSTAQDADDTPMLRRKKVDAEQKQQQPASSLIANLTAAVTPPHDFSSSLELANRGTVLFPGAVGDSGGDATTNFKWSPPEGVFSPNDGALQLDLNDFDVNRAQNGSGNNTVAIKFMAPIDSKRFSINIAAPPNHDDFNSVLFHFNPRQREKGGQLVVNDKKDGDWGQALAIPLSQVPLMFGQTACTLVVQINGEGFDIFVENQHCARLEHRTELPSGNTNLILQFPSTDDRGNPENWVVYKVWWGNKPIMAKGDVSGVAGVNSYSSLHPRKLFISGLSKIFTEAEVDVRRAELERAFRKYGGDRGVDAIVPTNTTYAFVEMESERMAELALSEMANKYRMNRARRSRHEALQEERAAAEAAKLGVGGQKEDSAW